MNKQMPKPRKQSNQDLEASLSVEKKTMFASVMELFGSSLIVEMLSMLQTWKEGSTSLRMLMDRLTVM